MDVSKEQGVATSATQQPQALASPWFWIKDSAGRKSVSVTFVTVAFSITSISYLLSIFQKIGPVEVRAFDSTACLTFLGPILALYFGRKMNDKSPVQSLPLPPIPNVTVVVPTSQATPEHRAGDDAQQPVISSPGGS